MCYDRKDHFPASRETFNQIASSFKFDASGAYQPEVGLTGRRAVLLGALALLAAAMVVIVVVIAVRRRPAPPQGQYPPYPPQYPPQPRAR